VCLLGQLVRRSDRCASGARGSEDDPAPLSARQLRALAAAVWRELGWGLAAVAHEVRLWRARAIEIPDPLLRSDALSALTRKRGHTDGAALLWTIPRVRDQNLLRLLVAYEIIWDFLDGVNERGATAGQANGRQLHLALVDALDLTRPISDYYRHNQCDDDRGYLRMLVEACRENCRRLPSYWAIRPLLVREAIRAQVLAINHDLDPALRDTDLRKWATETFPAISDASWFELTGAASASLTIHALLTLCAEPEPVRGEAQSLQACAAYFPWISTATTMLDSYVDQVEDTANGDHSYVSHYPTPQLAATRIRELVERSLVEARSLRDGERHVVIVACMVAMYLSKDSAHTETMSETTGSFVRSGGSLTRMLLPILRLWRIAYDQQHH
jgi:tetraprenyl-beta-curcumene synthase